MREAKLDKEREIKRLEKRYNDEIEEMENLLFEVRKIKKFNRLTWKGSFTNNKVQEKLANGTKGSMPEGKFWIFMQREEYDDLGIVIVLFWRILYSIFAKLITK